MVRAITLHVVIIRLDFVRINEASLVLVKVNIHINTIS
jgi:hypothetical protein